MAQTGNHGVEHAATTGGAGGSGGNSGLRWMDSAFARRPLAMAGLAVLVLAVLDTLLAPLFVSTRAAMAIPANIGETLQWPSGAHLLGTGGAFFPTTPWLLFVPLVAVLILYASLNLVGFGLRRVWSRQ